MEPQRSQFQTCLLPLVYIEPPPKDETEGGKSQYLLQAGIIEDSCSAYSAPITLYLNVKKVRKHILVLIIVS